MCRKPYDGIAIEIGEIFQFETAVAKLLWYVLRGKMLAALPFIVFLFSSAM